jgi:hypothetical protein
MGQLYVWYGGDWIPVDRRAPRAPSITPMIIKDIEPYQSMATGERIRSRRHHRDHLRAHRLIEVGNEYNKGVPIDRPPEPRAMTEAGRRDAIEQAIAQVAQGGARRPAGHEGDEL